MKPNQNGAMKEAVSAVAMFGPLFEPKSIAVVGASSKGGGRGNVLIRRIQEFGYTGAIFPIHPSAETIDGLQAYPSFAATPTPVDYAYIAIPGREVLPLLAGAAGRVRFAQVISSGFGEVAAGRALQEQLVTAAQQGGARLIGPNCLGIYSPRGRITFTETGPKEIGSVGVVSQSGGLGTDIIRRGFSRGIKFSGLITVGNCADVNCSDLVEYYLADPQTRVIGMYIESASDGRRLFEILRRGRARKPVVILKGGRTQRGRLAAASHTGSLGGDDRAWVALSRQTGCLLVETLNQFIDTLLIFQTLPSRPARPTSRVVLFGNGGGTSVLATDFYASLGLDVAPFEPELVSALASLQLPPGASITNPVDCPVGTLVKEDGRIAERIIDLVYERGEPDAVIMHLNVAAFAGRAKPQVLQNLIDIALRVQQRFPGRAHFVLVLRSDGDPLIEERKRDFRARAVLAGIPVFDEMADAGYALAALRMHERFLNKRGVAAVA